MKLLQSFKILQNLAADLGPVLALLELAELLNQPKLKAGGDMVIKNQKLIVG